MDHFDKPIVDGYVRSNINNVEAWMSPQLETFYNAFYERCGSKFSSTMWGSEENTDAWVMSVFKFKRNGTFIEGGSSGRSNTWNLENALNWRGVCIEPNTASYKHLLEKSKFQGVRKNALNKCLYSHCGTVDFWELREESVVEEISILNPDNHWNAAELSCVVGKARGNHNNYLEKYGQIVKKECITLEQVIVDYQLPNTIDFLHLDIENCEKDVFSVFPFDKYRFSVMCIEDGIAHYDLLVENNYVMVENTFYPYRPYIDYYYAHKSAFDFYPFVKLDVDNFR